MIHLFTKRLCGNEIKNDSLMIIDRDWVRSMNKLQNIIYLFIFFCSLTIVPGCDYKAEEAEISASKKALEKQLADPASVQYRNITIAQSLDGLKYRVDYDKVSEVLVRKAPNESDYPKMPASQFKLLVSQAENEFIKSIRKKVAALNADIAKDSNKNVTGVCLEFSTKNKTDEHAEFKKALCLYTEGDVEAECLNVNKNSLFDIDLTAVCK